MRPFLKWAGGKRQLLPALREFYPSAFGTYYEPFLGSGAVFFDLAARGRLDERGAVLSDENADLIGCYLRVRDAVDEVIGALEGLAAGHARDGASHYRRTRDRFNERRRAWRDAGADLHTWDSGLAATFIYLNRTGYNGLYRVNQSGDFNVPPGRYARPRIVDAQLLHRASAALGAPRVRIELAAFESVVDRACPGDFVYFDPPYAPLSPTASFRSYTAGGFGETEQVRLQHVAVALARRGVHVLLSNSSATLVANLYERAPEARSSGLQVIRVPARRAINTRADRRGPVDEVIVSSTPRR